MDDTSIPELSPEEVRHQKRLASYARYRARHREQRLARSRAAYATNRQIRLAKAKAARRADVDKARARDREQRLKHHETRLAYDRAYKAKNREQLRASDRLAYHADVEESRRKDRESYQRNADKRKQKSQKYRLAHPGKDVQQQRAYRAAHPEYNRINLHKRKARKAAAPINDFTRAEWRVLCKAAGYRCCYCGEKFPADKLTPDHLTPYAQQGSNTLHNILPCCGSCNSRKKDRPVLSPVQPFLLLPAEDAAAD